jgi:hypothetical protein
MMSDNHAIVGVHGLHGILQKVNGHAIQTIVLDIVKMGYFVYVVDFILWLCDFGPQCCSDESDIIVDFFGVI